MTILRISDDLTYLADVSAHLLAERIAKYPRAVELDKMTQAQADDGIRIMGAVAARWALTPLRDLGKPSRFAQYIATASEMHATLEHAAGRTAQIAAADPDDERKREYAAAVAALLAHAAKAIADQDTRRAKAA